MAGKSTKCPECGAVLKIPGVRVADPAESPWEEPESAPAPVRRKRKPSKPKRRISAPDELKEILLLPLRAFAHPVAAMEELSAHATLLHTWGYLLALAVVGYAVLGFAGGAAHGASSFGPLGSLAGGMRGTLVFAVVGLASAFPIAFYTLCIDLGGRLFGLGGGFLQLFCVLFFLNAQFAFFGAICSLIPLAGGILGFALCIYSLIWFFSALRAIYDIGIVGAIGLVMLASVVAIVLSLTIVSIAR